MSTLQVDMGGKQLSEDPTLINGSPPSAEKSTFLWALPRIVSFIFFVLLFVWIYQAEGKIGWDEDSVFGAHALSMFLFVVLFTTEAILVFRAPLIPHRIMQSKYFHLLCHLGALITAIVGIAAIVYYKNWSPSPTAFPFYTLYTPHSWIGVLTLLVWFIHLCGGFLVFVLSKYPLAVYGQSVVRVHQFIGKTLYVMMLTTCAMGFQDMQSSDLAAEMTDTAGYGPYSMLARLACGAILLLVALGVSVFANFQFR